MTSHIVRFARVALSVLLIGCSGPEVSAQLKTITLPPAEKTGGRPLMQVLQERRSEREFRREPLPAQIVSNLLWAAAGITRLDGRRTAPSASNRQEIDVYVAMPDGLFLYDARPHALKPIVGEDLRAATGSQPFVADAAVNLVYVADLSKMTAAAENQLAWAFADAGFVAENVYLYCASERLATVVRASVDREALAKRMRLRPEQRIILAQSVGYPKTAPTPSPRS